MTKYILRRIAIAVPIFFGVTIIVFVLINLAPGDPLTALIPPEMESAVNAEALRHNLGLDRPMIDRYFIWLSNMLRGNLGYSYITSEPVARMIITRLPLTLELTGVALLVAIMVGISFGVVSALRQNTWVDYTLGTLGLVWICVPGFVFALSLLYVFAVTLRLIPAFGVATPGQPFSLPDHLKHLIMPVTALTLGELAGFLRFTRSSMVEVLHAEYLTVARAKGLHERYIVVRHALRNALMPVVTILGFSIPGLFGGAVLIEQVFAWPGMGMLYLKAINQRDYPLVMGLALFSAALVLLSNLLVDIAYVFIDPRIKYE